MGRATKEAKEFQEWILTWCESEGGSEEDLLHYYKQLRKEILSQYKKALEGVKK